MFQNSRLQSCFHLTCNQVAFFYPLCENAERCIAAQCGNVKDTEKGITMHKIPLYAETCPIKQKKKFNLTGSPTIASTSSNPS